MSKHISAGLLCCLPFLLASCATSEKLPKRYKSYTARTYSASKDSIKHFVGVSGYVHSTGTKQEKEMMQPAKNIFSLSGEGQQQLIESIADNEKNSDDLLNRLSQDIIPASHSIKLGDHTRFSKKISFSVDNMHLNPADRIMKLNITLSPTADANVAIVSAGKLTSSNKTAVLSSGINAGTLTILEEDKASNDLAGSIMLDVAFEYKGTTAMKEVYSFGHLYNRDRTAAKPAEITATQQRIIYPDAAKDLSLACTYEAVVRHVVDGDNTISEADDEVEMIRGKAAAGDMAIISKEQLASKLWNITDGRSTLEINGPSGQIPLLFASYEDAIEFVAWFKRVSSDILANSRIANGDYKIMVSGEGTLTDSFISGCKVRSL